MMANRTPAPFFPVPPKEYSPAYLQRILQDFRTYVTRMENPNPPTGTVLQQISGFCDGRTVSGVTFPSVTATQALTGQTYQDITGSDISYTPPLGTRTVIYEFHFQWGSRLNSAISHFRAYLDSDEITLVRSTFATSSGDASEHGRGKQSLYIPIQIGDTNDVANAKVNSWPSAKTIKISGRNYSTSYQSDVHENRWWDGVNATGTNNFAIPVIKITALA